MSYLSLVSLAFVGGVFLAVQGGFNAQLGMILKNPLLASLVAFCFSAVFALLFVAVSIRRIPSVSQLLEVPVHLWFSGALFSVVGISLYYYTMPRLGIASMISLGLIGQLLFSVIAGHFGWFGMLIEPVGYKKIMGVLAMITGILLINN